MRQSWCRDSSSFSPHGSPPTRSQFSKLSADQAGDLGAASSNLVLSRISLPQVLEELVDLVGLQTTSKGIELVTFVDVPLYGAALMGDALRVRQCLCALVDNAVKFTSSDGSGGGGGEIVVAIELARSGGLSPPSCFDLAAFEAAGGWTTPRHTRREQGRAGKGRAFAI